MVIQLYKLAQALSATAINNNFIVQLANDYNACVGIALKKNAGAGTFIKLGVKQDIIFFNPTPIENWTIDHSYIPKDFIFRKCNIPAKGKELIINLIADTITTALDWDVYLMLDNIDCKVPKHDYNFQHQQITVPNGTATKYETVEFKITSACAKAIGFAVVCGTDCRIGIKDASNKNYIFNPVRDSLLKLSDKLAYDHNFYPVDIIKSKQIIVEVEPLAALGADLKIECVFLTKTEIKPVC